MEILELKSANNTLLTKADASDRATLARVREVMDNVSNFMYKNVKRRRYAQDFGAKADDKREIGCSMAPGSNIVSAQNGVFTGSDLLGKKMKVPLCGPAGNDLVGTITSKDNDGQVRLDVSADAGAPVSTGNRTVYWGTDDTTAIRNAVTAIDSSRRGILCFDGMSTVAGGLIGTVGGITYNCQIAIPYRSYTDATRGSIEFEGSTYMNSSDNGPGNVGYTRPSMECDGIHSYLTTSSPGAAVIATGGAAGINFTYTNAAFRRIKILVPTNSTGVGAGIGGINMQWAGNHQITECIAGIDDSLVWSADPIYNHIGFENNNAYSDGTNIWQTLNSYGFRDGYKMSSEHMVAILLQAFGCGTAYNLKEGFFSLTGINWQAHWGGAGIRVTGSNNFKITGFEVETISVAVHPITGAPFWAQVNPVGLYIDETVGKTGRGFIVGGHMTGSVAMGFTGANVGANVGIHSYAEHGTKMGAL